jgi:hypothetical protein
MMNSVVSTLSRTARFFRAFDSWRRRYSVMMAESRIFSADRDRSEDELSILLSLSLCRDDERCEPPPLPTRCTSGDGVNEEDGVSEARGDVAIMYYYYCYYYYRSGRCDTVIDPRRAP